MAQTNLDDAGFDDLFDKVIAPALAPFEADRKRVVTQYFTRIGCLAAAGVIFVTLMWTITPVTSDWPFWAAVVVFMTGVTLCWGPLGEFTKRCKTAILGRLAEALGLTYAETFAPPEFDKLRELRMLPSHDRSEFEDKFSGHRHGCDFDLYEAELEEKQGSGKDEKWVTVFRGQIIRIGFPKKFLGVTVVNRNGVWMNKKAGLERVGMGSSQFERIFEVWGSDQVEARFLVHSAFMERLMALENGRSGADVRCGFVDGDLLIVVDGANLFEVVKVFSPVPDRALTRRGVTQINQILGVIDVVMEPPPRAY